MRRFRRKSCRAQPPGFPDAISLHFLWGRMRWQRNCVNLVPVKILKGFVPSVTSYSYSSLALDNIPSILTSEDCVGKGVSEVVCVFGIIFVITYCALQHQGLFKLALHIKGIKATGPHKPKKMLPGLLHWSGLPSSWLAVASSARWVMFRMPELGRNLSPTLSHGWKRLIAMLLCYFSERKIKGKCERHQSSHSI